MQVYSLSNTSSNSIEIFTASSVQIEEEKQVEVVCMQKALSLLIKAIEAIAVPILFLLDSLYLLAIKICTYAQGESKAQEIVQNSTNSSDEFMNFYLHGTVNREGITFSQILARDDNLLESDHAYIQWLFPKRIPSKANANIPALSEETIAQFKANPQMKKNLLLAFKRMLSFYGLELDKDSLQIKRSTNFQARAQVWLYNPKGHHNFLRITRIISSLGTLGLPEYAKSFYQIMQSIAQNEGRVILSSSVLSFWRAAVDMAF